MENQNPVTPNASWQDRLEQALSSPRASSTAQLEALVSELEQYAQPIQQQQDPWPFEHTPFDDLFPPLLLLAPLLALPVHSSDAQLARHAIDLFGSVSSPKEVVVALQERIAQIGQASQDQAHDDEDSEPEDEQRVGEPSLQHSQLREIVTLVEVYAQVFPRIKTVKPARFLETATDSVTSILTIYCMSYPVSTPDAAVLAKMVAAFIKTIITKTTWSDAQQQECNPLLQSLLFSTSFTLAPLLPTSLAETYFFSQFPHRRIPHRETPRLDPLVQQAWSNLIESAHSNLNLGLAQLFDFATSTRGAFELFVHVLARDPQDRSWVTINVEARSTAPTDDSKTGTYSSLLGKTLGALIGITREGLSRQGRADEALFWLWWCAQGASQEHEMIDEDVLFPLVEIICTFASLSPSPSKRFIAFSLLSTLILDLVPTETTQILILKDLIETCPFPNLQSASIGILRKVLLGKFDEVDQLEKRNEDRGKEKEGLWLSPLLLIEFKELFKLVSLGTYDSQEVDQDRAKTLQEQLSLLYVLLSRDRGDRTGIWKGLQVIEGDLLGPLRKRVGQDEGVEGGFGWGCLEIGLERIDAVVKGRGERG